MNKFTLILSSFLMVSMVTPSMTYGTWDDDDLSSGIHDCTRTHPCYYENGHWHALDNSADNSWTSYEISTLTATIGMTIFMPLVHNAISRFLDYAAYKWYFWRGLKDTGQDLQTVQLRDLVRSSEQTQNHVENASNALLDHNRHFQQTNILLENIVELLQQHQQNPQGAILPQPD